MLIKFFENKSLGFLFTRPSDSENWEYYSLAQGSVTVQKDLDLLLILTSSAELTQVDWENWLLSNVETLNSISLSLKLTMLPFRSNLDFLAKLQNLKALFLRIPYYKDADYQNLAYLKKLEILEIPSGGLLTDKGFEAFAGLENLRVANFTETKLTDAIAKVVRQWPNLTRLKICGSFITGEFLAQITNLTTLKQLYLGANSLLNSENLASLASFPFLELLDLAYAKTIDDRIFDYLRPLVNLKELNLTGTSIIHLADFGEESKLLGLSVEETAVTDSVLSNLLSQRNLEVLNISGTQTTDKVLTYIQNCANLKVLDISYTKITDVGISLLANLTQLEQLNLRGLKITTKTLDAITQLPNLKRLDLSYTAIGDENLDFLKFLPNLDILIAEHISFTDKKLAQLEEIAPNVKLERNFATRTLYLTKLPILMTTPLGKPFFQNNW